MDELKKRSRSLSDQEDLEEETRLEAEQTSRQSEEQWTMVLQTAEGSLKRAEVQYCLSRETEVLGVQAGITRTWIKNLQEQVEATGRGCRGTQAEIQERLNKAQVKKRK